MLVKSDTDSRKLSKVSHNTTLKQNVNTKYETVYVSGLEMLPRTSDKPKKYESSKPRVIQLLGNPIHAHNSAGYIKKHESTLVPSSRGKGMKAKYLKEV